MSLYSIAAASLTTADDHTRRPNVDAGQIARTFGLCLLVGGALVGMHHRSQAVDPGFAASRTMPTTAAVEER